MLCLLYHTWELEKEVGGGEGGFIGNIGKLNMFPNRFFWGG